MDRVMVYDGALPQASDILFTNKFAMVGQAYQNRAILGSGTVVAGLACTPTSPTADLHVTVGVGSIYQMDPTDASAFGDLGTDNNSIMKQGILQSPVVLSITPPSTAGFSQVFLVQAILNDVDAGALVLSYYNSANPASPYSGPANSGTSNFTTRTCPCVVALKAGVAATTGTQVTPSPDAGYVSLYAVTVANGQTQITSGSIAQATTAPFFPTLPGVPIGVLDNSWAYGNDTGAVNAMVVTLSPIPAAYVAGMQLKVKAANTITSTTVTLNVNGLGNVAVKRASGAALVVSPTPDITSGQIVDLIYDGVNFQMANYLGLTSGAITNNFSSVGAPYVADTGTTNAVIATFSPAITGGQQVAGLLVAVKLANTITGACTINVNALGVKALMTGDLQPPPNSVYVAGEILLLFYDGTQYQIVNTSSLTYRKPAANLSIFVNGAIGNDANDGVSNTSGHALATIQAGVNKAFSYAPSQFTITVVVEPGVYNESVKWPTNAGPAVVVDGLNAASVTINSANDFCFLVQGPNTATINNITAQNSGPLTRACFAAVKGALVFTNNTVSNAATIVFLASSGTIIPGPHTFSGSASAFFYVEQGGNMALGYPYTISAPVAVSIAVAVAHQAGILCNNPGTPFINPGFVSGPKFYADLNGVVNTQGNGIGYFPGSVAGSTATGGQYG